MREIKFRAWDSEKNRWLDLSERHMNPLTGKVMEDTDNSCSDPECCGGPFPMWADQERYKVTQFIGLKDKNVKKIYVGDIIAIYPERVDWHGKEARYWIDETLSLWGIEYNWNHISGYECTTHIMRDDEEGNLTNAEIIGNIYENSELLKNG